MARPIPLADLPVFGVKKGIFPDGETSETGGILPVDKPEGWTSFDVVRFVRNRIGVRKTGHAGTLDPMATGLLLLCFGRATKSINQIQLREKVYLAEVTFGASTPSFDADTQILQTASWEHLTQELLEELIREQFTGVIDQVPPVYSALKKNGQRMYQLARKGVAVEPVPRQVEVHDIEILEAEFPKILLRVRCGKGFYVRSLANDLARAAGTLGYLSSLRRTSTGEFGVDDAWTIEQIKQFDSNG